MPGNEVKNVDEKTKTAKQVESTQWIQTIVPSVIAVVAISVSAAGYPNFWGSKKESLEDRIVVLTSSLNSAARTITQIEDEIASRRKLVEKLKIDADTAQAISALNQKQTEAIAQSLRVQLEQKEREGWWWSVAQNIFFAALGAAFGEISRLIMSWRRARRINAASRE
jgi:hypothetical protein